VWEGSCEFGAEDRGSAGAEDEEVGGVWEGSCEFGAEDRGSAETEDEGVGGVNSGFLPQTT